MADISADETIEGRDLSRRKLIQRIGAGAAIAWATPVISTTGKAFAQGSPGPCETVFSDTFEQETCGLNQTLTNWIVARTIDIIGNGCPTPFVNAPGKVVDLDGTTPCGGATIDTNTTFPVGTYEVRFQLGGSQRNNGTNSVRVSFGSLNEVITLNSTDPLTTFQRPATLVAPAKLRFQHLPPDDCIGLLLNDVVVCKNP